MSRLPSLLLHVGRRTRAECLQNRVGSEFIANVPQEAQHLRALLSTHKLMQSQVAFVR